MTTTKAFIGYLNSSSRQGKIHAFARCGSGSRTYAGPIVTLQALPTCTKCSDRKPVLTEASPTTIADAVARYGRFNRNYDQAALDELLASLIKREQELTAVTEEQAAEQAAFDAAWAIVVDEGDTNDVSRNNDGTFTVDAEWLLTLMEEAGYATSGN